MAARTPQYAVTIVFDRSWETGRWEIEVGDRIVGQRTQLRMGWGPDDGLVEESTVAAVLEFVGELWREHLRELDMGVQERMV